MLKTPKSRAQTNIVRGTAVLRLDQRAGTRSARRHLTDPCTSTRTTQVPAGMSKSSRMDENLKLVVVGRKDKSKVESEIEKLDRIRIAGESLEKIAGEAWSQMR